MRKLFVIIGVIAFLGMQNVAVASGSWGGWGWFPSEAVFGKPKPKPASPPPPKPPAAPKPAPPPPPKPPAAPKPATSPTSEYLEIIKLLKKQIEVKQKQLQQEEGIYASITGNRTISQPKKSDRSSFFLDPHYIYSKTHHGNAIRGKSLSVEGIEKEENINNFTDLQHGYEFINERLQHAIAVDKAVSLQAFAEAEERFEEIAKILTSLNNMQDLKGIAEMQARMKIMLAMIQNEATKLHMITYSRNAEQALINQQKRALNSHIFRKGLTTMPHIKINESASGSL